MNDLAAATGSSDVIDFSETLKEGRDYICAGKPVSDQADPSFWASEKRYDLCLGSRSHYGHSDHDSDLADSYEANCLSNVLAEVNSQHKMSSGVLKSVLALS